MQTIIRKWVFVNVQRTPYTIHLYAIQLHRFCYFSFSFFFSTLWILLQGVQYTHYTHSWELATKKYKNNQVVCSNRFFSFKIKLTEVVPFHFPLFNYAIRDVIKLHKYTKRQRWRNKWKNNNNNNVYVNILSNLYNVHLFQWFTYELKAEKKMFFFFNLQDTRFE